MAKSRPYFELLFGSGGESPKGLSAEVSRYAASRGRGGGRSGCSRRAGSKARGGIREGSVGSQGHLASPVLQQGVRYPRIYILSIYHAMIHYFGLHKPSPYD